MTKDYARTPQSAIRTPHFLVLSNIQKRDVRILPEIAPALERLDAAFETTDLLADGGFVEALDKLDAMAAGWL